MDLWFGTSAYDRERGNFTPFPVVNMFAEQVPVEGGVVLQSRPGLTPSSITMGSGPIRYLYQIDGVLTGVLHGISGNQLYSESTPLGTINGDGPAKLAGYEDFLFANAGADLWGYDGTTFALVPFPDDKEVIDICVGASRLVAVEKDTGVFYWSDVLSENIDALSFATAENSPDKLKACLFIGDTLILFGTETVEFWPISGDSDLPFQPLIGRVFQRGIRDTGCAATFNSSFAWITDTNAICIGEPTQVISEPDLEAKLKNSVNAHLWTLFIEGTEYLAVRLDDETWLYSSRSGQWSTFESYGEDNFIPQCSANDYMGSSLDGQILEWTADHTDFDDVLERRFRAGVPVNSGTLKLDN
jgi:hypothetical protein